MKTAIVTTVKDAKPYLETFIRYHLEIGFDYIFLFFDDPDDPIINEYSFPEEVIEIVNDERLDQAWKNHSLYPHAARFLEREVMARQIMNANLALQMCLTLQVDWLLHIDSDELFHLPSGTVKRHFEMLDNSDYHMATYCNHEAVAELVPSERIFQEIGLFKRNYQLLNDEQRALLAKDYGDLNLYFNFYKNGKSAVKVSLDASCLSCHLFTVGEGKTVASNVNLDDQSFPYILHYACCTFDVFWQKYRTLGEFGNKWFDQGKDIEDIVPIHIHSRNICLKGDLEVARSYYNSIFIEKPEKLKSAYLREGIFFYPDNKRLLNNFAIGVGGK